jgi:hypothetical protein
MTRLKKKKQRDLPAKSSNPARVAEADQRNSAVRTDFHLPLGLSA